MTTETQSTRDSVAQVVQQSPGLTSDEIGAAVGVSGARVRQILAVLGYQRGWIPTREVTNGRNTA